MHATSSVSLRSTASPQGEAYARQCRANLYICFGTPEAGGSRNLIFSVHQGHPRKLRICAISARRAEGLCRSVDSIHVFNNGDGTGGALSAFLPPFVAQDKRRCPRGMSAISFGQFRTSGIAGAARFTATSTYFGPPLPSRGALCVLHTVWKALGKS